MSQLRYIFSLLFAIMIVGCAKHSLTEADAVRIARQTMEGHGQRLSDFTMPDPTIITNGFAVLFLPKSNMLGGDFLVVVDGQTGRAELVRGQ